MKLSAVVQLIDSVTQLPLTGDGAHFLLEQTPYRPLSKPQAFYAFSNLDDGAYELTVHHSQFFSQKILLTVPMQMPLADGIVPCYLQPSPLYPYPEGTTLIRGRVLQSGMAQPLAEVVIDAGYQNWRAQPKSRRTCTAGQGQYNGRYALALTGRLEEETQVSLRFSKPGYAVVQRQLKIQPGTMQFVDIDMQPE